MAANLPGGHGSPVRSAGIRARHGPRRPRTAARQPPVPGHDADGRAHAARRGAAHARRLRGGRPQLPRHRRRLRRRRLRADARAVAGAPARRGRAWRPRSASPSPIPAGRASPPSGSCGRATPRCGGWGSTSSTSTRSTRPTPTSRSRTRWRPSTASCAPARCARSAPRTSPPGCWRGRSAVQDREGLSPFVSLQPQYSLVERSIETEILPFCRAAGLGVLPWGPLGAGFLTGRYERDAPPPAGTRIGDAEDDLEEALHRRGTEANFRAVDEARAVADELGATVAQVAIAWLLAQPGVTAPILGPRTLEQLEDLLPAARAGADRRADAAARPLHRPAARLSRAHEHRAERPSTSAPCGCAGA